MLTIEELDKLEKGKFFVKENLLGKGIGGKVYNINDKYVVKKINKVTRINYFDNAIFNSEVKTNILLSLHNISPKVIYHSNSNEMFRFFVMEKLDITLCHMIKNKTFSDIHLIKLKKILLKLQKTNYFHCDLHLSNIMWSNYYEDFRIIDWGYFTHHKQKTKYNQLN